ncbi:MAG: NAD(P)-binding domain-containing protein [Flavobacteriales bacterium]
MSEKIAVLGTGDVGQAFAAKFATLNYDVYMGTNDVQQTSQDIAAWLQANPTVHLVTFDQAAAASDKHIFLAVNGASAVAVCNLLNATSVKDKIVTDVTNPLDFTTNPPTLFVCNTDSLGEQVQRALPGAKVIKAFNTMNYNVMVNPGILKGDHYLFICGNDAAAKAAATGGPYAGLACLHDW